MPATLNRSRFRIKNVAPTDHPLRTEREYNAAVAEIDALIDLNPKAGSRENDRLELLSVLVEAYENEHDEPIARATPQELVEFMAEQKGVSRAELAELMGGRSRLSDFLNKHRLLSTNQITKLRDRLGIPADLLLGA